MNLKLTNIAMMRRLLTILLLLPLLAIAGKRHRYPFPVDKHGHPIYLSQDVFVSEGRILVQRPDSLWGYMNAAQQEVIPCIYQFAEPFCNGKALVMLHGKYGVIDTNGKEIVPCLYTRITEYVPPIGSNGHCFTRYVRAEADSVNGIYDLQEHQFYPDWHGDGYSSYYEGFEWYRKIMVHPGKQRLFGLTNERGVFVLQPVYSFIGEDYGRTGIRVARDGKWGFVSLGGREIVPIIYESAKDYSSGFAAVKQDGKWGFVNRAGQLTVSCKYDAADMFEDNGLAIIRLNGKWGVVDTQGRELIAPVWQGVKVFRSSFGLAQNGKWALADASGTLRTAFIYDDADLVYSAFVVKQKGLYGLRSRSFKDSLPCLYTKMYCDRDSRSFRFCINDKWGVADSNGQYLVPAAFSSEGDVIEYYKTKSGIREHHMSNVFYNEGSKHISNFYRGRAIVRNSYGKRGYINRRGRLVIPYQYTIEGDFETKYASVMIEDEQLVTSGDTSYRPEVYSSLQHSLINRKGILVRPWRSTAYYHYHGLLDTLVGNKQGLMDLKGKIIIPPVYKVAERIARNRYLVRNDTNAGVITRSSKTITPVQYRGLGYSRGRYEVLIGDDWHLLNKRGKHLRKLDSVAFVNGFRNGLGVVENNHGLHGYINKKGKLVIPFKYKEAFGFVSRGALVSDSATGYCGIINRHQHPIIPLQYDILDYYNRRGPIAAKAPGFQRWAFINKRGKRVTPFMFSAPDDHALKSRLIAVNVYGHHYYINRRGRIKLEVHIL